MYKRGLLELEFSKRLVLPTIFFTHSKTCPTSSIKRCPGSGRQQVRPGPPGQKSSGSGSFKKLGFKRAERCGPVRFGFVPEEWFTFFHSKTGVSGFYVFGFVLGNYLISKEKFIMEHEYYCGLSIALMLYLATTKFGPAAAAALDKEVDAEVASWQKGRDDEIAIFNDQIKAAKDAQWRALGQELLMAAKKENIMMQLEAAYRERSMYVYRTVKGRMDYHVKRFRSETRIHQRWMIQWILNSVMKSITPEFEKQALDSAIRDLAAAAERA